MRRGEVSEYRNSFNIADYTRNLHGMMTGKIESVEIRFSKNLTTAVIDKFGVDLTIKDKRKIRLSPGSRLKYQTPSYPGSSPSERRLKP